MTRQLAGDLARFGVRVNSVSPLGKNSCVLESQRGDPEEFMPSVGHDELLGVLDAEAVAESIVAMLLLRGVTGQDLVVDGGCSVMGVPRWKPFPAPTDYPQITAHDDKT